MSFLTRKDVARIALCSIKQVERNEELWGLVPFRVDLNERVIRYEPVEDAIKALVENGIIHSVAHAMERLK